MARSTQTSLLLLLLLYCAAAQRACLLDGLGKSVYNTVRRAPHDARHDIVRWFTVGCWRLAGNESATSVCIFVNEVKKNQHIHLDGAGYSYGYSASTYIPLLRFQPSSKMGNSASTTTGVVRGGGVDQGRAAKRARTDAISSPPQVSDQMSILQDENDRLKRQLAELRKENDAELRKENDAWIARLAEARKERDGLKKELDEWKDGEGRRAAVLGRDLSGRPVSAETQKLLNAVAGHTESREIVRLREELYKTKDCLQHVQRLAEEHSEDYETVVSAGRRGDDTLSYVKDPARRKRLQTMIRQSMMPGEMGDYYFGFQKGMLAAGRMYHDFAHAVDDEHDFACAYEVTPDERRANARDMFPSGDT